MAINLWFCEPLPCPVCGRGNLFSTEHHTVLGSQSFQSSHELLSLLSTLPVPVSFFHLLSLLFSSLSYVISSLLFIHLFSPQSSLLAPVSPLLSPLSSPPPPLLLLLLLLLRYIFTPWLHLPLPLAKPLWQSLRHENPSDYENPSENTAREFGLEFTAHRPICSQDSSLIYFRKVTGLKRVITP